MLGLLKLNYVYSSYVRLIGNLKEIHFTIDIFLKTSWLMLPES